MKELWDLNLIDRKLTTCPHNFLFCVCDFKIHEIYKAALLGCINWYINIISINVKEKEHFAILWHTHTFIKYSTHKRAASSFKTEGVT